jgi:hypothetical protein
MITSKKVAMSQLQRPGTQTDVFRRQARIEVDAAQTVAVK